MESKHRAKILNRRAQSENTAILIAFIERLEATSSCKIFRGRLLSYSLPSLLCCRLSFSILGIFVPSVC